MNKFMQYLIILFLLVFAAFHAGCGAGVTETGNPTTAGEDSGFTCEFCYEETDMLIEPGDDADAPPATPVEQTLSEVGTVLFALCGKVSECHTGVEDLDCIAGIYQDENLLASFGVDTNVYMSMEEVQTAIDDGGLSVSSTTLGDCETALDGLNCAQLQVVNAFDEDEPDDFSGVYRAVPDGCGEVF